MASRSRRSPNWRRATCNCAERRNLLGIAKRNLRIAEENEELVNTRFANGIATTLDLAQARAQQPTIAATLPPLRSREAELRRVPKTVESSQVVLALRDYLDQRSYQLGIFHRICTWRNRTNARTCFYTCARSTAFYTCARSTAFLCHRVARAALSWPGGSLPGLTAGFGDRSRDGLRASAGRSVRGYPALTEPAGRSRSTRRWQ